MCMYVEPERPCFTPASLQNFLICEQELLDISVTDCEALIRHYEPTEAGTSYLQMGCDGFAMLLQHHFPLMRRDCGRMYHDMERPLTHYHILAAHNTYLEKDQVRGPSSVDAYVRALRLGARVVEVDVWDSPDGPVVYNGYTATGRLPFQDVVKAIAEHAFDRSTMPLLVFVEQHCNIGNQRLMVDILRACFGAALYITLDGHAIEPARCSPAALQGRVVLVGRRLPEGKTRDGEVSEDDEALPLENMRQRRKSKVDTEEERGSGPKKMVLIRELSDLFAIDSRPFGGFGSHADVHPLYSLDDTTAARLSEEKGPQFAAFCRANLVRVYPSGLKVNSENYDAFLPLSMGVQVPSLNVQTDGAPLRACLSKFRDNGGCGFVLKSRFLASDLHQDFCAQTTVLDERIARRVVVRIVSGSCLPLPGSSARGIVDPYVVVSLTGLPCDTASGTTKAVENNRLHPFWSESFTFAVQCPDEAVLCFAVFDDSKREDNFIGQFGCPLSCMGSGYRHVALETAAGQPTGGSLLVQLVWTDSSQAAPLLSGGKQHRKARASTLKALSSFEASFSGRISKSMPTLRHPHATAGSGAALPPDAEAVELHIGRLAERLGELRAAYVARVHALFKAAAGLSLADAVRRLV